MERRLLLSTVAVALVLGSVAVSAQTPRPPERNQNAPQAAPAQNEPRANPQSGAGAQNAPMPQAQQNMPAPQSAPNAQPPAPRATTGQAAPQPRPNPPNAANQAQQPAAGQAQPQQGQAQPQRGQAQPQPGMPAQGQAQGQAPAQPGMAQGNMAGANDANAQQNANTNANANAGAQGVITLNEQQNTRVAQAIRQANVRPLANVSFSIAVGTTIPADIQLNVLPLELVEVVPQYRGYSFVVVEQEALIIDPGTRAIVAVVPFEARQTTGANTAAPPPPAQAAAPAPPPAQAAAPPRESKKLELTRDQREIQRRQAERHHKADKNKRVIIEEKRTTTGAGPREPRVGDRVPDGAVIEGRPVEVYRNEPPVREERHHPSVRDIPLIGPLFGPRDED